MKIKCLLIMLILIFTTNISFALEKIGVWKKQPIKVYIEENRRDYLMKRAFYDWEAASSKLIEFEYTDDEKSADIVVKFKEKVSDVSKNAVGLTYPYVRNGEFVHARIEIAKYSDLQSIKLSNHELLKIMRHEIGHAIGLPHTNSPNSIMNPITNQCLDISKDDVKYLRTIYNQ